MRKSLLFIISLLSVLVYAQTPTLQHGLGGKEVEYRYEYSQITYTPKISGIEHLSSYECTWTEVIEGNSNELQRGSTLVLYYTVPNVETNIGKVIRLSARVQGMTKDSIPHQYDETIHYSVYAYKQPSIAPLTYDSVLFVGQTTTLSFSTTGGKDGAWQYVWSLGGNQSSCEFIATQPGDYTVTVDVKNILGNTDQQYDYTTTLTYKIKVWPACEVQHNHPQTSYRYTGQTCTYAPKLMGGDPNKWTYNWTVDGNYVADTETYTHTAPAGASTTGLPTEIKVELTNAPDNVQNAYKNTLTYTLYTYDYPTSTLLTYDSVLFVGQTTTLSFSTTGGKDGAWQYVWSLGGNQSSCEFIATQPGDYTVTVDVKNILGNTDQQYDYNTTLTYKIKVWPACEVQPGDNPNGNNCFEQQAYGFSPILKGGDPNKWAYEWYVNDQLVSTQSSYAYTSSAITDTNSVIQHIVLKLTNTPDNIQDPYTYQINYQLVVWRRGSIMKYALERELCHSHSASMYVNTSGGYPYGWSFKWSKEPDPAILSIDSTCSPVLQNTTNQLQKQVFKVIWQNTINGYVGSQGIDTIILDVYPAINTPSLSSANALQMRDIDTLTLSLNAGKGGNPNGWYYTWGSGDFTIDSSYDIHHPLDSELKEFEQIMVVTHWQNRSPNGKYIWAEGELTQDVIVYNTPKTPVLKVKGNGTSNIYIIDGMDMTEEELWAKEYHFRFWDGNSIVAEVNDQRWCKYNTTPTEPKVQSVWYYDDGFICESDLVCKVNSSSNLSYPSYVNIYRIYGEFVSSVPYDTQSGGFDLSILKLQAGIYILQYVGTHSSYTEKVIIK